MLGGYSSAVGWSWYQQGLLFWLFKGGFKVSSGTVKRHGSGYGADFDTDIAVLHRRSVFSAGVLDAKLQAFTANGVFGQSPSAAEGSYVLLLSHRGLSK